MLDRVAIGYSALGNRGLLWIAGSIVVALATDRAWAVPLVTALVWLTLVPQLRAQAAGAARAARSLAATARR